jgi:hypothetical protein
MLLGYRLQDVKSVTIGQALIKKDQHPRLGVQEFLGARCRFRLTHDPASIFKHSRDNTPYFGLVINNESTEWQFGNTIRAARCGCLFHIEVSS